MNDKPGPKGLSPISLGLLYDQLLAVAEKQVCAQYWETIFTNIRWLISYEKMVFLLKQKDKFYVQCLYQKGAPIEEKLAFVSKPVAKDLYISFCIRRLKWVAEPHNKYKKFIDGGDPLVDWLVKDENAENLLIIPMMKHEQDFGVLILTVNGVTEQDKILLSTMLSIYASFVVLNSELNEEMALKKEKEEELLQSESVREKLSNLNTKLNLLNDDLKRKVITFNKFVPVEFLKILGIDKETDHVELGYSKAKFISILFSDIRQFTKASEGKSSSDVFRFVNDYLAHISPAITNNNGFIDKFIGDAIMALFTTPEDSIRAALSMMEEVKKFNQTRKKDGLDPVKIGIGLNCGVSSIGTIGFEKRLETTVLGSTVNMASRLESLTKDYEHDILVPEVMVNLLKYSNEFTFGKVAKVNVRGIEEPVNVFYVKPQ